MRRFFVSKPVGLVTAIALAIAGAVSPILGVQSASAAPSLGTNPSSGVNVVVSSTTTLNGVLDPSNDLQVTGYPAGDLVRVVVSVDSGSVQLTSASGLTAITGYSVDTTARTELGWQSTQADANTALNGLKYIAGSSAGNANITLTSSYAGPSGGGASPAYYAANGHYYQYISTTRTWTAAQADVANNPLTYTFNGLRGYLATVTSSGENSFVTSRVGSSAVWLGARRDLNNTNATGDSAWYWTEGPEATGAGAHFYNQGGGALNGAYINWNSGEPNGTTTAGESAMQLLSGGSGQWNDLQASDGSQLLGYVVEYGGMPDDNQTYTSATRILPITVSTNQIVDVNWTELNFDYANKVNKVGTGFAVNDKVLFQNVTTRNGVCVDGVVTTKALSSAVVKAYESGTHAGGTPANFEVDIDLSAAGGSAQFQFDFYVCGTYGTNGSSATKVVLKNTGVTAIDIDYNQWNELTNFDSYTLASDTKIHECAVGTACNTTHQVPVSYPASLRFQGPSSVDATIVQDQVVANYGSIDSFTIKFGNTTSNNPNYFGVAFKGLPWGTATPATQGGSTTYNITYDGNGSTGGTAPANQTGVTGKNFAVSGNTGTLVRAGYTFAGWNTAANGTGTSYSAGSNILMPNGGTTLYAVWTPAGVTLTYNANGGSGAPAGANYSFGSSVTVSSTVPTYAGYTFTGWNTRCDGTGTSYSGAEVFTMGGSSVELCAQWSANGYQLVYDGNGGTGVPNASSKSFGSTVTVTSTIPSRSGYSFIAWNTLANGTGSTRATAGTFVMPSANVTLYAIWSLNAYTVYYNMNGGTGSISPQPARFGNNITVSNFAPTRAGYTFAGWNTEALGAGTSYAGGSGLTMPASNVTLYAQWTPNNYTLNYDANGGGGAPAAQNGLHAGDAVTLSATTPTQTGFRFNGWNTRADGTGVTYLPSSSLTMPTGNVYVYALWVAENLELIYNANGGTGEPAATTAATLSTVTVTSITPTRTGYNFTGWNTQAGGGGTSQANGSTFTMPNTAVTLYAQWTRKTVTLHYNLNGGAAKANMLAPADVVSTFETIESLDPANDFEKTNANFVAWNTRADGTGTAYAAESDYVMPDSDVTLYAQWSGVYYVVEYNANGGSGEPAAQIAAAGENLNLASQTPNLNGYEFTGWTEVTQGSTYNPGASLTMPSTNVTMLANYRVRTSSLGGSAPVTTPVTPTPPVDENGPTPDPIVTVAPLTVKEMVFFKGDKSALLPTTITALKKLIAIAKKRGVAAKITIIGRVKETADKSYDMKLSKARAVNVANYLKKAGLQGPYSVVAAGISPENRWVSRRVEITVTWPKK